MMGLYIFYNYFLQQYNKVLHHEFFYLGLKEKMRMFSTYAPYLSTEVQNSRNTNPCKIAQTVKYWAGLQGRYFPATANTRTVPISRFVALLKILYFWAIICLS